MSKPDHRLSTPLACGFTFATCVLLFACASRPTVELPELASLRASLPLAHAQAERGEGPPEWVNQPREDDEWVYGLGIVPVSRSSSRIAAEWPSGPSWDAIPAPSPIASP